MGIGTIVCGRNVTHPLEYTGAARESRMVEGWFKPFGYSEEYVFYVRGVPLGEIYILTDDKWQARIYPHLGKEYDTQNEAMLFLEAIAALGV